MVGLDARGTRKYGLPECLTPRTGLGGILLRTGIAEVANLGGFDLEQSREFAQFR